MTTVRLTIMVTTKALLGDGGEELKQDGQKILYVGRDLAAALAVANQHVADEAPYVSGDPNMEGQEKVWAYITFCEQYDDGGLGMRTSLFVYGDKSEQMELVL